MLHVLHHRVVHHWRWWSGTTREWLRHECIRRWRQRRTWGKHHLLLMIRVVVMVMQQLVLLLVVVL